MLETFEEKYCIFDRMYWFHRDRIPRRQRRGFLERLLKTEITFEPISRADKKPDEFHFDAYRTTFEGSEIRVIDYEDALDRRYILRVDCEWGAFIDPVDDWPEHWKPKPPWTVYSRNPDPS